MAWTWTKTPAQMIDDLNKFVATTIFGAIESNSDSFANEITAWMKQNAVWEDRTGEARDGLHVTVSRRISGIYVYELSYSVDYGFFLETMQAGSFSILTPAIAYFGPRTTDLVRKGAV